MMKVNKVLILGNSITKHPGLEGSGWELKGCGMAASAPEKDFVHLLLRRFTNAADGRAPEAMVENFADFEREHASRSFAGDMAKCAAFRPDVVILAIGENVPPLKTDEARNTFYKEMTTLLTVLRRDSHPAVFVRSCFWEDKVKDDVLRRVCEEAGGTFISLAGVDKNEANFAHSERAFSNVDVGKHPGDPGMKAIADAIWSAVENWQRRMTKQLS